MAKINPFGTATAVSALTLKKAQQAPAFVPVAPTLENLTTLVDKCKALVPEAKFEAQHLHRCYRNTTNVLKEHAANALEVAEGEAWERVCYAYGNLVVMLGSKAYKVDEAFAKCVVSQLYALRKGIEALDTASVEPEVIEPAKPTKSAAPATNSLDVLLKLAELDTDKLDKLASIDPDKLRKVMQLASLLG